jgi:tetratricopeptide (TPR) repeat protein
MDPIKNQESRIKKLLLACCVTLFFSAPAHADVSNPYLQRELFRLYAQGAYKARIGDWAGALMEFERAYRYHQTSPEILVRYAEALMKTGRTAEAEKFAMRATEEDSSTADAHLILAEIALGRNDLPSADRHLSRRLQWKPDDLESRLRLGFIRESLNDLEGVVAAFEGYPSLRPGAATAHFHRGVALVRLKKLDEARRAFRDALRETPGYVEAAENIAILEEELDDDSAAIAAWDAVLKIDPERTEALRRKLMLLMNLERFGEAIADLERLLAHVPDKTGALRRLLVQTAIQTGDYATAARSLLQLAHRNGTETGYLETALVAAQAGSETDVLVASLDGAYRLRPRAGIGLMLVRALSTTGQDSRALHLLETMAIAHPEETTVLWNLAIAHHKAANETRAVEIFIELIEKDPMNASALNYVGYTWAERGIHLDRAEEYIRRAIALDPENAEYIDSLGWIYYQRRVYDLARLQLEKAWHLLPTEPTIMEHLGDVYVKMGMMREALQLYRGSLATGKAEDPDSLMTKIDALATQAAP